MEDKKLSSVQLSTDTKMRLLGVKRIVYIEKHKLLKTYEDIINYVIGEWLSERGVKETDRKES
jgi:sulfur relay (sulfurtransferase) DsrF/TusC family protein